MILLDGLEGVTVLRLDDLTPTNTIRCAECASKKCITCHRLVLGVEMRMVLMNFKRSLKRLKSHFMP